MSYEFIQTEVLGEGPLKTGLIRLHRPKQLNALCDGLMDDLGHALHAFDADEGIGCIVLTGSEKAFAAGADIAAMVDYTYMQVFMSGYISRNWEAMASVQKPVIGAVAGFALGGGCEVAMMCDMLIAADNAKFGQPEVKIGMIPGAGGTQRLPRTVGKALAMDLALTGRMMGADEALRAGLVSRVVTPEQLMPEALAMAEQINGLSQSVVRLMKQCVNEAFESPLASGLRLERRVFHSLFGTYDQHEGMAAFLEKRKPEFKHR